MSTYVIAFESSQAAMAASKTLASGSVDFRTISAPAAISAGCDIAVEFDAPDPEEVLARIFGAKRDTGLASLYRVADDGACERICAL
ncbi:DUF3343 domain-containing protein [Adlercreutzia sp. ZJ242]|uniref:DUF3343 domain-containing protein n=1 Tax=Adlercreutzia sp. ZJ242 TaxID=2709409 RepID=UPI0013EBB9D4|nr:DUF3343 domain-containing protein [Adlercreutzia sp. ZJ242]